VMFILPTVVTSFENRALLALRCETRNMQDSFKAPWVIRHFDQISIWYSSWTRSVLIFVLLIHDPVSDWLLSGLCENGYFSGSSPHVLIKEKVRPVDARKSFTHNVAALDKVERFYSRSKRRIQTSPPWQEKCHNQCPQCLSTWRR
jgi:hypothetical protein